ncbi:MAG: CaiB/BaiF CoA-transferase family protein [Acidobacteriota bacterium]|nr:CaiB/BaiF CoA-transferase family protein [Acidobacteriota bacterium]
MGGATNTKNTGATLPKPLEDITVLDMTVALAGPFATLLLAGLGARVLKVENPAGGDNCRENAPYLGAEGASLMRRSADDISVSAINRLRNKLAITLNLKHPEARAVFADLVRKCDVLVENYSRGTLDRLGVGYRWLHEVNPRLVYCSITGFGSDDDSSPAKAMDTIIQAQSGMMYTSGEPEDPPIRVGIPMADLCAPMFGVIGVLAAIHQAQRTGIGQHIDVSMLGALTMMVSVEPFDLLERCGIPQRTGQTLPRLAPFGVYPTKDGFIALCAPTEAMARAFFEAAGHPEMALDEKFSTRNARVKNFQELNSFIEQFTRSLTSAEAVARLERAGAPAAEVRTPYTATRDPRVVQRGETVPLLHPRHGAVEDVYGMGMPFTFSGSNVGFDQPPPELGEHNDMVYGRILGYSSERIAELKSQKVI